MPMQYPRRQRRPAHPLPLMVAGIALLAVGLVALPAMLPGALAEERAYVEAPPCSDAVASPHQAGECRGRHDGVVVDEESTGSGRGKRNYAIVEIEGDRYRLRVVGGRSSLDRFDVGDRVTAVSWRGELREFAVEGEEAVHLASHPVGFYKGLLIGAVFLTLSGGMLLWTARCERLLRRTGRSVESVGRWTWSVPILTAVASAVVAVIPVAAAASVTGAFIGLACTVAGGALVGALLWRRARRQAEQKSARLLSGTLVAPLAAETVIPARVMGEVPYSRWGDEHLVIGPGGMAATPDPRGVEWRSRRFGPLAFVRLHPVSKRDPRVGRIPDPLLVECRDGDREVLIMAARDRIPLVLGGLWFPPPPR